MKTFKVTIEVTDEELKKLDAWIRKARMLDSIGAAELTIESKIAERVIMAFLARFAPALEKGDDANRA